MATALSHRELSAILDGLAELEGPASLADTLHALRDAYRRARDLVLDEDGELAGPTADLRELVGEVLGLLATCQELSAATHGDLCFAGRLELADARRSLESPLPADEQLAALESARRRLCRTTRAVLGVGFPGVPPVDDAGSVDLEESLAVRRLYARFRRQIRRPADDSGEAVLVAARYAAGALAALVTAPEYPATRASDRHVIRRLHARVLAWARGERGARDGVRVLEDVWACADLLRGVNRREVLRAHDGEALAVLAAGPGARGPWLARLQGLEGLDDQLDRLIEAFRTGRAHEAQVDEAFHHVSRLHAERVAGRQRVDDGEDWT